MKYLYLVIALNKLSFRALVTEDSNDFQNNIDRDLAIDKNSSLVVYSENESVVPNVLAAIKRRFKEYEKYGPTRVCGTTIYYDAKCFMEAITCISAVAQDYKKHGTSVTVKKGFLSPSDTKIDSTDYMSKYCRNPFKGLEDINEFIDAFRTLQPSVEFNRHNEIMFQYVCEKDQFDKLKNKLNKVAYNDDGMYYVLGQYPNIVNMPHSKKLFVSHKINIDAVRSVKHMRILINRIKRQLKQKNIDIIES